MAHLWQRLKSGSGPPCVLLAGVRLARVLCEIRRVSAASLADSGLPADIADCLRHVREGRYYVGRTLVDAMGRDDSRPERQLSPWQEVVLSVIGQGLEDSEAASQLAMAPATVGWHRKEIMRKLGLHRASELIRWAIEHAYVDVRADGRMVPGLVAEVARSAMADNRRSRGTKCEIRDHCSDGVSDSRRVQSVGPHLVCAPSPCPLVKPTNHRNFGGRSN